MRSAAATCARGQRRSRQDHVLRAFARADRRRFEFGSIALWTLDASDLIYHPYIDAYGPPRVEAGAAAAITRDLGPCFFFKRDQPRPAPVGVAAVCA